MAPPPGPPGGPPMHYRDYRGGRGDHHPMGDYRGGGMSGGGNPQYSR